jgi:alpha-maltose-1-phosphate synthase
MSTSPPSTCLSGPTTRAKTRVVFLNGGILGLRAFSAYIREAMASDPEIDASHIDLSERITVDERIVRRLLCVPLWPTSLLGLKNIDLRRFRSECHAGLQARRRLRPLLARGVDVLHFHHTTTAYGSLDLIRRVPAIISIDCTQDVVIQNARTRLERWTYQPNAFMDGCIFRRAASIISMSQWAADCLHARYPDCATHVHVMPTPVRMQFFPGSWLEERKARESAGYIPEVLFVGGDFVRKGGEDLLAVWQAERLHRLARLTLVTNWPLNVDGTPGVRVRRGIEAFTPEWCDVWRAADIFVMPTRDDTFGQVFQEAAAAGLARIGTSINAIPELIADGRSGLLLAPGDRQALAAALRSLIGSASLRHAFGAAARAHVIEHSSPGPYRDRLRSIIHDVAGKRAASAPRGAS